MACPRRRAPMPAARPGAQRGYVLLATIVIVLVMTLLASSIALTSARAVDDRRLDDERLQAEIDARSTEAGVFYLLATQRQTFRGLTVDDRMVLSPDEVAQQDEGGVPISLYPVGNEIRLDGTVYKGVGGIRFALQDDRGRVNVNWQPAPYLARYLATLGVKGDEVAPLLAKLKDYQDADDLFRLNGAEADDYRKAGMDPPDNRPLVTPLELRRVLGWREALAGLDDAQLVATISLSRNPQINVNTAGPAALQMIPGVGAEAAQRVVARRQQFPFTSVYQFSRFTGLFMDDDQSTLVSTFAGGTGTLDVWSDTLGVRRQIHWALTPLDDGGRPWRSQYQLTLSLPENRDVLPPETPGTKVFDDPAAAQ